MAAVDKGRAATIDHVLGRNMRRVREEFATPPATLTTSPPPPENSGSPGTPQSEVPQRTRTLVVPAGRGDLPAHDAHRGRRAPRHLRRPVAERRLYGGGR